VQALSSAGDFVVPPRRAEIHRRAELQVRTAEQRSVFRQIPAVRRNTLRIAPYGLTVLSRNLRLPERFGVAVADPFVKLPAA
jgi:hypothetical protein